MTELKVSQLSYTARVAKLDGVDALAMSTDDLARLYNGIGPESLPEDVRAKITDYLALFEPAALIHDVRYSQGDGTRRAFNYANWEFRDNCDKLAAFAYPWYNWRRYRAYAVAALLFDAVASDLGWQAFCKACNPNNQTIKHPDNQTKEANA